jgi:hypothetical protein
MANFDVSNLSTAQTLLARKYAQPEMRMKPCPTFDLLSGNSNVLIESAETLRTRDDRAIEANLMARTKRASGSGRTYNHTGAFGDSNKITLAWTTKSDVFSISLKLLDKNLFDFNAALANGFEQMAMNILEDKETEAVAYLRSNRATQQPTLKGATFNAANDAVEVSADEAEARIFFARTRSVMTQNYFKGPLDLVGDSNLAVKAGFLAAQGSANATNTGYQFQNMNIVEATDLTDANYTASAMVMPAGTVAALNWIPKQNRDGHGDYNTYVGGFGSFRFLGYTFAVHGYTQRANTVASNGNEQDNVMEFELSLDSSFNKAPLNYTTNRTDSVIIQMSQLS